MTIRRTASFVVAFTIVGCGSNAPRSATAKADPTEFCRLNISIGSAASAAGRTDPAAALEVFRKRTADMERQKAVAPDEIRADFNTLVAATGVAVNKNDITLLVNDRGAMTAKSAVDRYCAAK
jgi:protein-tyrosine-phosphatase